MPGQQPHQVTTNYLDGLAAEANISRIYETSGCTVRHNRWCAVGGELDLVIEDGDQIVFCEVKKGKTLAAAAERMTPSKQARVMRTAQAYLAAHGLDQLTDIRFDVALLDQYGQSEILKNALI